MKYWKQGFYDEPIEGSVEIEDDYYNDLLEGQSEGKEIYAVVVLETRNKKERCGITIAISCVINCAKKLRRC